jgi:hypothetical protein
MFVLTHPDYIRDEARQMRTERNLSIDEIAERLTLPRTTIFYRVRDVGRPVVGPLVPRVRRPLHR